MQKSGLFRVGALLVAGGVAVAACTGDDVGAVDPATPEPSISSTVPVTTLLGLVAPPPTTEVESDLVLPRWATRRVVAANPATLEPFGPAVAAGYWVEGAVVTDDVIAVVTWTERADSRWRLVVADRFTGDVFTDQRLGDMNVLGMFPAPSGEVLVVEPIRSSDQNSADGFVIHGYDHVTGTLSEVARFADGDFNPATMTVLGEGLIGVVGWERNTEGFFDRIRIVVFDWKEGESVTDVVLDDLPLESGAPEGAFAEYLGHATVWDVSRNRALVAHADEDVVTTVGYPSGDVGEVVLVDDRSLLEALFSWLIPPAHAKGLASSERHAVISGDQLFVASSTATFTETDDGIEYSFTPTGMITVDLESLKIVNRTEAPIGFVAAARDGGYLLGGGRLESGHIGTYITMKEQSTSGLLVIDPETLEVITVREVDIWLPQDLHLAASGTMIYIDNGPRGILMFDPATGEIDEIETTTPLEAALIKQGLRYAPRNY